ncbi:hypothetical protein [Rhodococcus qingshengii]|uniref:hypothetical protein n=1 Tax=Rhodococcus qingshengii TaxID=334542 RepID=UPI0035E182DB
MNRLDEFVNELAEKIGSDVSEVESLSSDGLRGEVCVIWLKNGYGMSLLHRKNYTEVMPELLVLRKSGSIGEGDISDYRNPVTGKVTGGVISGCSMDDLVGYAGQLVKLVNDPYDHDGGKPFTPSWD